MKPPIRQLLAEVDIALRLLRDFDEAVGSASLSHGNIPAANLFKQCLELCAEYHARNPEPIRTIHHFACTGGTLISKCVASMPNVQLLSEMEPFSTLMASSRKPDFSPTDMISLARNSTRGAGVQLSGELFHGALKVLYDDARARGLRLVLRDHAHSHYCHGDQSSCLSNLRDLVAARFPVLSIVTVRDPIDSFLSLQANNWLHFEPSTFDEYCRRYIHFLRDYQGVEILHYEKFVDDPVGEMRKICALLDMPFNPTFQELFDAHSLSGDSGRSGGVIGKRDRRFVSSRLEEEIRCSSSHALLRSMLGYEALHRTQDG